MKICSLVNYLLLLFIWQLAFLLPQTKLVNITQLFMNMDNFAKMAIFSMYTVNLSHELFL